MDPAVVHFGARPTMQPGRDTQRQCKAARPGGPQVFDPHDQVLIRFDERHTITLPYSMLHGCLAAMDIKLKEIARTAQATRDLLGATPILGTLVFARDRLRNQPGCK